MRQYFRTKSRALNHIGDTLTHMGSKQRSRGNDRSNLSLSSRAGGRRWPNWADEYVQQRYVLSDQLLYETVLQAAGSVFRQQAWQEKARALHQTPAVNYLPHVALSDGPRAYHPPAYRHQIERGERNHWVPAFFARGYSNYFSR